MVSRDYRDYKNWRDIGLAFAVFLALVGGVLGFSAYGLYQNISAVKTAVDANPTHGAGTPAGWLTSHLISSIVVIGVPFLSLVVVWLGPKSWTQDARSECDLIKKIGGRRISDDIQNHWSKARRFARRASVVYYIVAAFVFLSLGYAGVTLVWASIGLANTTTAANDHYFFLLTVIGFSIAGGGHLLMIAIQVYLGMRAERMCTLDKFGPGDGDPFAETAGVELPPPIAEGRLGQMRRRRRTPMYVPVRN